MDADTEKESVCPSETLLTSTFGEVRVRPPAVAYKNDYKLWGFKRFFGTRGQIMAHRLLMHVVSKICRLKRVVP